MHLLLIFTLLLSALGSLLAGGGIYHVKDMETISMSVSSPTTIRYTYTPIFDAPALLCINVSAQSQSSPSASVTVLIGSIPVLCTLNGSSAAIPLATLASAVPLTSTTSATDIDFVIHVTAPIDLNFTAGIFKELLYGTSVTISSTESVNQQVIPVASDGLHDILLKFDTDGSSAGAIDYTIELYSLPFSTKRSIIWTPRNMLLRSVGNTYQYTPADTDTPEQLTAPAHLYMESNHYFIEVHLQTMSATAITIAYVERYQRFTPTLMIDYYDVPIHYTMDLTGYDANTQILMSSTCVDPTQVIAHSVTICLRYNIVDRECSLELKHLSRYAWMTINAKLPRGYLSSVYISSVESTGTGLHERQSVANTSERCKIFLTNVEFITEKTDRLSFMTKSNRQRSILLVINNPLWIKDELMLVVTLHPFFELNIANFRPYVELYLSTETVYPDELNNEKSFVMDFSLLSDIPSTSDEVSYLHLIANRSAIFRLRRSDFPSIDTGGAMYMTLRHSLDLSIQFLKSIQPSRMDLSVVYGSENAPISTSHFYYLDIGHTKGLSILGGYLNFEACASDLFVLKNGTKEPLYLRVFSNLKENGHRTKYTDMQINVSKATVHLPIYSAYTLFVQLLNSEFVAAEKLPYRISYTPELPTVVVADPSVRVHVGFTSTVIEIDGAQAPLGRYAVSDADTPIYIAYAVYVVSTPSPLPNVEEPYPTVPISRCSFEAALSQPDDDSSSIPHVARVGDWLVAQAITTDVTKDPYSHANYENKWSMLYLYPDLPPYKYTPCYLVVVAAVDTKASKVYDKAEVDPLWGHTIDPDTIRFYEPKYLSSAFKGDELADFDIESSPLILILLIVLWILFGLSLITCLIVFALFLRYRSRYKNAKKPKTAIQLVNVDPSMEISFGQQGINPGIGTSGCNAFRLQKSYMELDYNSFEAGSAHSTPLMRSLSHVSPVVRYNPDNPPQSPCVPDRSSHDSASDPHRVTSSDQLGKGRA